jgi:hypothetical protein
MFTPSYSFHIALEDTTIDVGRAAGGGGVHDLDGAGGPLEGLRRLRSQSRGFRGGAAAAGQQADQQQVCDKHRDCFFHFSLLFTRFFV